MRIWWGYDGDIVEKKSYSVTEEASLDQAYQPPAGLSQGCLISSPFQESWQLKLGIVHCEAKIPVDQIFQPIMTIPPGHHSIIQKPQKLKGETNASPMFHLWIILGSLTLENWRILAESFHAATTSARHFDSKDDANTSWICWVGLPENTFSWLKQ